MRNFRIWSIETKRCEAVWLGYLLTLCGCQVWRGSLSDSSLNIMVGNTEYQYVDVLLFDSIDEKLCNRLVAIHSKGRVWISGKGQYWDIPFWWGVSDELEMSDSTTLIGLMNDLCSFIVDDENEKEGIRGLTLAYVEHNNALVRNIYIINELFCSRQIDYSLYESRDVLVKAIAQVEEWYLRRAPSSYYHRPISFSETFALTYIQNMIDDAFVKAKVTGGFDVRVILSNANYLLNCDPASDAALFLKLRILRNCLNYPESPDEVLKEVVARSAEEYRGRAYCEMGDICRENRDKIFDFAAAEYFEKGVSQNPEEYCGLYKLGYLYGQKGQQDSAWLEKAETKYLQVIDYLEQTARPVYRTPQEFEYYYKAGYGLIKSQIEKDQMSGYMSDGKREDYQQLLEKLMEGMGGYQQLYFWHKFYGEGAEYDNVLFCMKEKMGKIRSIVQQLFDDTM